MPYSEKQIALHDNDIVALLLNGDLITRKFQVGSDVRVITRAHMRFMAACDLGPQWKKLAEAPAIAKFKRGVPTDTLARLVL